ncbi:MAG: RNA ligase family protein [Gallionellaceae bacterium]
MSEFRKYMHVERFGNDEVQGIELGKCYIFPKIDGTNASIWFDNEVKCGSRNRELSLDSDNAGFMEHVESTPKLQLFVQQHPDLRLYGEWLVPHSLKTYREDAWRKFYVFDVFSDADDCYLTFDEYSKMLDDYDIDYISPNVIIRNATYENILKEIEKNTYLVAEGRGIGEGIVIKNYEFRNRFECTTWAKIVTNEFKEKHKKAMGIDETIGKKMVEQTICDNFVTQHMVDKVYSKIATEMDGWNSRYIARLLQTVFYDLVNEEIWNFVKKNKNPTINFRTLSIITTARVKECRPELF